MAQPFLTDQQILGQTPETADIARQRKIADLLTSQAFNQPQGGMVSGYYVAPSWSQQLQPLAAALGGSYLSKKTDEKAESLAKALRQKQVAEIEEFTRLQETDPGAALGFALSTNNPTLQSLAKEELKGITLPEGGKYIRPRIGGGVTEISGEPKKTSEQRDYELAKSQGFQGSFLDYQRLVKSAGATTVNVNTEKAYGGEFGQLIAKNDVSLYQSAQKAPDILNNVERTKKLLDDPNLITGFGAQQRLDLARLGSTLGVGGKTVQDTVSNTQQLFANRAQATLDAIKESGLGAGQGFTNTDREFLEKARLGNITFDRQTLKRQLEIEESVARASANKWNQRLQNIPATAAMPTGVGPINLPSQPQKTAPTQQIDPKLFQYMTPEQRKLFGG